MNIKLIQKNLKDAIEVINSPEYDEGSFAWLEALLIETLEEVSK